MLSLEHRRLKGDLTEVVKDVDREISMKLFLTKEISKIRSHGFKGKRHRGDLEHNRTAQEHTFQPMLSVPIMVPN